jgi:hypothetical protein
MRLAIRGPIYPTVQGSAGSSAGGMSNLACFDGRFHEAAAQVSRIVIAQRRSPPHVVRGR